MCLIGGDRMFCVFLKGLFPDNKIQPGARTMSREDLLRCLKSIGLNHLLWVWIPAAVGYRAMLKRPKSACNIFIFLI